MPLMPPMQFALESIRHNGKDYFQLPGIAANVKFIPVPGDDSVSAQTVERTATDSSFTMVTIPYTGTDDAGRTIDRTAFIYFADNSWPIWLNAPPSITVTDEVHTEVAENSFSMSNRVIGWYHGLLPFAQITLPSAEEIRR